MGTNSMWGQPPRLSTDANGNTVLVGADGVPKDRLPLPLNPNGLGSRYHDGQGYDPAAPTIGALAGT